MKLYILDKSMLNQSRKRKALSDITHMEWITSPVHPQISSTQLCWNWCWWQKSHTQQHLSKLWGNFIVSRWTQKVHIKVKEKVGIGVPTFSCTCSWKFRINNHCVKFQSKANI
jgi:hypothetical protein